MNDVTQALEIARGLADAVKSGNNKPWINLYEIEKIVKALEQTQWQQSDEFLRIIAQRIVGLSNTRIPPYEFPSNGIIEGCLREILSPTPPSKEEK